MRYKAPYKLVKSEEDQGWDIRADENCLLTPGDTYLVKTGLFMELEPGFYVDVRARSGMSAKGILCHTGLIDSGYRGEIKVCLTLLSGFPHLIRKGDRIAQLFFGKEVKVDLKKVDEIGTDTVRGEKGFGSSGRR